MRRQASRDRNMMSVSSTLGQMCRARPQDGEEHRLPLDESSASCGFCSCPFTGATMSDHYRRTPDSRRRAATPKSADAGHLQRSGGQVGLFWSTPMTTGNVEHGQKLRPRANRIGPGEAPTRPQDPRSRRSAGHGKIDDKAAEVALFCIATSSLPGYGLPERPPSFTMPIFYAAEIRQIDPYGGPDRKIEDRSLSECRRV